MTDRQVGAEPRGSGLQSDDRLAAGERPEGRPFECGDVLQSFDVEPEGPHLGAVDEGVDKVLEPQHRLISGRDHVGEGNGALAHREVGRQHATLGDDGRAMARTPAAVGEGPQGDAVDVVDEPIAVGADKGEIARCRDEARLVARAIRAGLAEARRIANDPARAHGIELGQGFDRRFLRHGEKHGIGRLRQVVHRCEAGMAADRVAPGVDRPERPGETDPGAFSGNNLRVPPADDGDMARPEQAFQIGAALRRHAPSGLSRAREMI